MARTRNVLAALAWAAGGVALAQGPPARPTAVEFPLLESGVCLQPAQPAPAPTAIAPPSATGQPPAGQADEAKKAPTVEELAKAIETLGKDLTYRAPHVAALVKSVG